MSTFLYLSEDASAVGVIDAPGLLAMDDRHRLALEPPGLTPTPDVLAALRRDPAPAGAVFELQTGMPNRTQLRLAREVLAAGRRVWWYWPREEAIEAIDDERLDSYRRHWGMVTAFRRAARTPLRLVMGLRDTTETPGERALREVAAPLAAATAVPMALDHVPTPAAPLAGTAFYLRTDFWARIQSGGSYGHTCYVAKELARSTDRLIAFLPHRYALLDDLGVEQLVMDPPSPTAGEDDIVLASQHYYTLLKSACQILKPRYIYERLCLGNFAAARLSQDLGIPYIVEYNGSEISMRRSFDGQGYQYERAYLAAEEFAFRQATLISVVSEEILKNLRERGVDPRKILVNPNGADLDAYAPATDQAKAELKRELGFGEADVVVGFTGTFGGWHGIDVLAAALPKVCERAPRVRWLLIGDGNFKHVVDAAIEQHGLQRVVKATGRVPQAEGARLLKACDILVSPHSSHMVDSKFFGSPTKVFEYMALAAGIVASDLEQIGEVLSPALRVAELDDPSRQVSGERAVLCTPGDVDEFVAGIIGLVERADLRRALGRNAREAVRQHYSWERHVAHVWDALAAAQRARESAALLQPTIATGDRYKDEVQRQWDNDPAGSHYVKAADPHTLEWFREVERYRYADYAPWMFETMEFGKHGGEDVLEIGAGIGTDLAQFATHGARVTDLDLSHGHLELARENFRLRGLEGRFVHHDAEQLPFDDNSFDLVYSNGVLHHTPNTRRVVAEIYRVLRPGGKAIVMMYAENSLHYWRNLVWAIGLKQGQLHQISMGEIMSRSVERSDNAAARPLVKVYSKRRLHELFSAFERREIVQRQMVPAEAPRLLAWIPVSQLGRIMGWNLIIKAHKPRS